MHRVTHSWRQMPYTAAVGSQSQGAWGCGCSRTPRPATPPAVSPPIFFFFSPAGTAGGVVFSAKQFTSSLISHSAPESWHWLKATKLSLQHCDATVKLTFGILKVKCYSWIIVSNKAKFFIFWTFGNVRQQRQPFFSSLGITVKFVPNLNKFSQCISGISQSQEWERRRRTDKQQRQTPAWGR